MIYSCSCWDLGYPSEAPSKLHDGALTERVCLQEGSRISSYLRCSLYMYDVQWLRSVCLQSESESEGESERGGAQKTEVCLHSRT